MGSATPMYFTPVSLMSTARESVGKSREKSRPRVTSSPMVFAYSGDTSIQPKSSWKPGFFPSQVKPERFDQTAVLGLLELAMETAAPERMNSVRNRSYLPVKSWLMTGIWIRPLVL